MTLAVKMSPTDEKALDLSAEPQVDGEMAADSDMDQLIDPKKEKILLAKLDLFFTPVIMLVYLSCFLDRTNIVCFPDSSRSSDTDIELGQCQSRWDARGRWSLRTTVLDSSLNLLR